MTINQQSHVAVVGATGYLGKHLVRALEAQGHTVLALVRAGKSFPIEGGYCLEVDVTDAKSLDGAFKGVDAVFTALGITRQTDHVTYEDIEYHANLQVAREAQRCGVTRFGVISAVNPQLFEGLAIMKSRERFIQELKTMGFTTSIIRATGFFSDLKEVFQMAKSGRVYLLGDGQTRVNPIHGSDLARACIDAWLSSPLESVTEVEVGGPDSFSWNQVAELAFEVLGRRARVTHLPLGLVRTLLLLARPFSRRSYDVGRFLCAGTGADMIAPACGEKRLQDFYRELAIAQGANAHD